MTWYNDVLSSVAAVLCVYFYPARFAKKYARAFCRLTTRSRIFAGEKNGDERRRLYTDGAAEAGGSRQAHFGHRLDAQPPQQPEPRAQAAQSELCRPAGAANVARPLLQGDKMPLRSQWGQVLQGHPPGYQLGALQELRQPAPGGDSGTAGYRVHAAAQWCACPLFLQGWAQGEEIN